MHLKMSKVCLVTGVGPETGTGAEIAKYFSENGFHVAMIARSEDNLKRLESKYPNTKAYPCDVADIDLLKKKINTIMEFKNNINSNQVIREYLTHVCN